MGAVPRSVNTVAATFMCLSACLPGLPGLTWLPGWPAWPAAGCLLPAGVDYEAILRQAEKEGDVVIWDGKCQSSAWLSQPDGYCWWEAPMLRCAPAAGRRPCNYGGMPFQAPDCRLCASLPYCLHDQLHTAAGGNNDTPFYKPDLFICVTDPHRVGHEQGFYPGDVCFR